MGFRNPITSLVDPVARQQAGAALALAQGKNTTYVAAAAPAAPSTGFTPGDQWIDTTHGTLNVWNGSAWAAQQWGSAAFSAGAITAGTIAAGAIDGMTITGATVVGGLVETASSGGRAELAPATFGKVPVYNPATGATTLVTVHGGGLYRMRASDTDTVPAELFGTAAQDSDGAGHLVRFDAGSTDAGTTKLPSITLSGGGTAGTAMAARQVVVDDVDVIALRAPTYVPTPTAAGHAATKDYVDNGQFTRGTFSGTTDANGRVSITHGLGSVPSFVECMSTTIGAVDTNAFALVSVSSTAFVVQLYYNGAVNKSAAATFNWRAWK